MREREKKKGIQADSLNPLRNKWGERWDLNPRPSEPQSEATTS